MKDLYDTWKANRTVLELFDFVFNDNGYLCEEFFESCWAGSQVIDCCSIFRPTYVMLRGRCFRLMDGYNQTDVDETDKLSIHFNDVQGKLPGRKNIPQMVMYIGDSYPEVGIYPRVYLNYHDWNRVRFVQKRYSMLHDNPECTMAELNKVDPLNCTLPYFKGMLPYVHDIPTCHPSVVVEDYDRITSTSIEDYHCRRACERVENLNQMITSPDYSRSIHYAFRVETSFTDLEYEHYTEMRLTTFPGFISELGGQSGLFVGCSVMTIVQLGLWIVTLCAAFCRAVYLRYFSLPLAIRTGN
ncbi:unnamed protein product [Nippostrongylus brasiliensis]|uniref:Amiloride-sensitive sodium channel n=1 Tax=Nippostrongylus brasiliensis TaxID=27835 RepID=A0A0N4YF94_NIPBR|nr:unnamed protein product [Nippostrongylus brasiliensis]